MCSHSYKSVVTRSESASSSYVPMKREALRRAVEAAKKNQRKGELKTSTQNKRLPLLKLQVGLRKRKEGPSKEPLRQDSSVTESSLGIPIERRNKWGRMGHITHYLPV